MAKYPLTVYLPRVDLTKLEMLARQSGVTRSAFANDAIQTKLQATSDNVATQHDKLTILGAAVEELIARHPEGDAIRLRLSERLPNFNLPTSKRKPS
jgi:hypothetical protein